jgi:plastin-1
LADNPVCKKILPIRPNSFEIFNENKNYIILCGLINKIEEETIDERAINTNENITNYQKSENFNLIISAAKRVGINAKDYDYSKSKDIKNIDYFN